MKTVPNRVLGWFGRHSPYTGLAALSLVCGASLYATRGLPIGGDILIPFSPDFVGRYIYSWNSWVDLGTSIPYVLAGPPLLDASVYAAMESAGLSLLDSIWFYFTVMSFVGAASTCYLLRTLVPVTRSRSLPGFVAGLVFLYNPLYVVDTYKSLFLALAERATFPLAIALYANGLEKRDMRYSVAFACVSFVLLGRFPVIATKYGLATIVAVVIMSALKIISSPVQGRKRQALFLARFATSAAALSLAANAYWIVPFFVLRSQYGSTLTSFTLNFDFNATSTLLNVVRLLGPWPFYSGYAPYSATYAYNPVVIASTFVLPTLAFAPLLVDRSKRVAILGIIMAALVFLSKGTNDPFGELYRDVVSNSFLKVFYISDIFQWFLLFSYCVMIGVATHSVLKRLQSSPSRFSPRLKSSLFVSLMLGSLLIASWPLPTGQVMTNYYDPAQKGVSIPDTYFQAAHWLRAQNTLSRVFVAQNTGQYSSTDWGFQGATQFYQLFFPSSIITGTGTQYSSSSGILRSAYDVFNDFSLQTPLLTYGNWSLRALENSTWTTYQADTVKLVNESSSFGPYIDWQILSNDASIHEISKTFPSPANWTGLDLLVVALRGNFNATSLAVGVADNKAFVGWFYVSNHIRAVSSGWQILFLRLNAPDESTYDLSSVESIWLRYYPEPHKATEVSIADIHLAYLSYDSIAWAKTLGLLSAKYVLTDDSLEQNRWDYPIQNNSSAFTPAYESGPLTFHLNRYASDLLYGASKVSFLPLGEDPVSIISQSSFLPNDSAFITDEHLMTILENVQLTRAKLSINPESPTYYRAGVSSPGSFLLVFSQNFDPEWTACLVGGKCFTHFVVNSYANGWYIDAPGGNYQIVIRYGRQYSFSIALGISILSVLAMTCLLIASLTLEASRRKLIHL